MMENSPLKPPPEACHAFLFAALAIIVNVSWIFTVGFWSAIGFSLVFSFWKKHVTFASMQHSEMNVTNYEELRTELRKLSSKLWTITLIQYVVWIYVWQTIKK